MLLRSSPDNLAAVQKLLKSPSYGTAQAPFWKSVLDGNREAFGRYFGFADSAQSNALFERWQPVVGALRSGEPVPFAAILGAVSFSFELARTSAPRAEPPIVTPKPVSPVPPPRPRIEPRDGTDGEGLPEGLVYAMLWFQGRLSRRWYVLYMVLLHAVLAIAIYVIPNSRDSRELRLVVAGAYGWSLAALTVKRSHDYNSIGFVQAAPSSILILIILGVALWAPPLWTPPDALGWTCLGLLLASLVIALVHVFIPGNPHQNDFD
jgi:uncharacterized membrane protein YhaH (DUF805 family)